MAGDDTEAEETNFYLITLQQCRDTLIPGARDAISTSGDPGSPIAGAVAGGGWVCDKATEWTNELLQHTSTVIPAFDDAISDVNQAISAERAAHGGKDTVPKGDPHGIAWARVWHNMQQLNRY